MFGGFPRGQGKIKGRPLGAVPKRLVNPFQKRRPPPPPMPVQPTASDEGTLLSILVLSKSGEGASFETLTGRLRDQAARYPGIPPVEFLVGVLEGRSSWSVKNRLLQEAQGAFAAFLDETDDVSDRYLEALLGAIRANPAVDCVGFLGVAGDGWWSRKICYSVRNEGSYEEGGRLLQPPGRVTPVRRAIALAYPFRESPMGEDSDFALRMLADRALRTEAFVDEALHELEDRDSVVPRTKPKNELKISCILTSYNRPMFLRQALRSLADQTHRNYEVLIFDDSSALDVRPIIAEFDLPVSHFVKNDVTPEERRSVNRLSLNINRGLDLAKGDLVCYLADDDYYHPGWFQAASSFFASNRKVVAAYGKLRYSTSRQMEFRELRETLWPGTVVTDPYEKLDHNQVVHRRFKPPIRWPEQFATVTNPDAHYFREVAKRHAFYPIDAMAAVKRRHEKNLQNTFTDLISGRAEGIRE